MKKIIISALSLFAAIPSSSWAEGDSSRLQVLICQTDNQLLAFPFLEASDGTLSLIGDTDATISKSEKAVTVLVGDKVLQFQDNQLRILENGSLRSSDCADVTGTIGELSSLVAQVGSERTVTLGPIIPAAAQPVLTGPPMTGAERESFRNLINSCWNVDPGSVAARATVEVSFTLTREGRVDGDTRLLSYSGDKAATATVYEAARRAILRCQGNGYELPTEKFEQWREVTLTFDPAGLKLR